MVYYINLHLNYTIKLKWFCILMLWFSVFILCSIYLKLIFRNVHWSINKYAVLHVYIQSFNYLCKRKKNIGFLIQIVWLMSLWTLNCSYRRKQLFYAFLVSQWTVNARDIRLLSRMKNWALMKWFKDRLSVIIMEQNSDRFCEELFERLISKSRLMRMPHIFTVTKVLPKRS